MESSYMFMLELAIVLFAAHLGGALSKKFKQPVVMGQIVIGLILGMGFLEKTTIINEFAQIGVVLLMFIAGLETDVKELISSIKSSSIIALGGILLPAGLVFISLMVFIPNQSIAVALFLAIVSTATSVSISVQTLREINRLKSKQGVMILGAAIIDDVAGIILLTLLVSMIRPGVSSSVGIVIFKILAFFAIVYAIGYLLVKLLKKIGLKDNIEETIITLSIVVCFIMAFLSEELGVAAITGAYFAGVIFSMTSHKHRVSHEVNKVATLIFTPIFFVSIGMDIDLGVASTALSAGALLIIFGSLGKVVGCGLGAKISGFSNEHSLQIGIGMVPRAEVAIIVANLGVQMAILSEKDMAATILMVLVSTLITPAMLKWSFKGTVPLTKS